MVVDGARPLAQTREQRFLGKVAEDTARCRGGDRAVSARGLPWVDWQQYWATGDNTSRDQTGQDDAGILSPDQRGIRGALLDLEYQRTEMIRFNLFDNSGTYEEYVLGRHGVAGPALNQWKSTRLPNDHPDFHNVGADGPQRCNGELVRFRTLTGICNDIENPLMGSTGQPFARNVQFEATFPDEGRNDFAKNRHGDRLGLLKPDPQLISQRLFTRSQSQPSLCNGGKGTPNHSPQSHCDYEQASSFNVLAAFWIQFMTHDWFSHLTEGHNRQVHGKPDLMPVGCATAAEHHECRTNDRIDRAESIDAGKTFLDRSGKPALAQAYKITTNNVTAWWDASQIYGYDEASQRRVKRDPIDKAKLLVKDGYLPPFNTDDPINPVWSGQEAVAFPDNWSVGLSFFHNVFAREHNAFVDEFRRRQKASPGDDCGLRHPAQPGRAIPYSRVSDEELFQIARLIVAAEIAKIHTTEWTTQLLYDEPLYRAMNANWSGLFKEDLVAASALKTVWMTLKADERNEWYSAFATGPGIIGQGNRRCLFHLTPCLDLWRMDNPRDINGGTNHFGSPFNFPEEFVTVYRLHPMVPDLLHYRKLTGDANQIVRKIPVLDTFRSQATAAIREGGLANWALSMGRQRLGLLTLRNHPQFLQHLPMPHDRTGSGILDVAALDLIRDRERGVPRFNEFRRQYGLKSLTSFDDFIDRRLVEPDPERQRQEQLAQTLRDIYGTHRCDKSKLITDAQSMQEGGRLVPINDCLGHPDGTMVDNIEDVDTVVGWLAEPVRPHGFAISETQFQVFILNASRRLFSDRFLTSSFRPEFYTDFGIDWITNNGPTGKHVEPMGSNGHDVEMSPLKRVLLRNVPELSSELQHVVNVFDPWGRDRGEYYSLEWKPRTGAESDPDFSPPPPSSVNLN
ncbi:MAG TPA: peroxidase family protein [Nitrospira sp.]|nr:peroxidase family protein [Nitrospira sp.]